MLGIRQPAHKGSKDEAEKPFWISFSDLMTALMVLFLITVTVTLVATTKAMSETDKKKGDREAAITKLLAEVASITLDFPGVKVQGTSIDFGNAARFDLNSHRLSEDAAATLRSFVERVLVVARTPVGQQWLKRITVEGFTDGAGTYIHNLNLSLQRSERVLCVLLTAHAKTGAVLSADDRILARELFLVGGSSFNSQKPSAVESRRVELRLEFLEIDEIKTRPELRPLDVDSKCPLDAV